jgi:uncharacterized repeat protein (TIGR01451 family)
MHKAFLIYRFCFIFLLGMGVASAQAPDLGMAVVKGDVSAVAQLNNTIYIGGVNLAYVGPRTGPGVPVDLATGLAKKEFPRLSGRVHAAVPDGTGGWFVGGSFQVVDRPAFAGLIRIKADYTLDTSWQPAVGGTVLSLTRSNNTLYVGGYFNYISNQPRRYLGAIDIPSAQPTPWNPGADGEVRSILVTPHAIYAGGQFTQIGGAPRVFLARLHPVTGQATAWNPGFVKAAGAHMYVHTLALHNNLLYAGGSFETVGGQARKNLVAVDTTTAIATSWNPSPDYEVSALSIHKNTLYVGGRFYTINGTTGSALAGFDATTGAVTAGAPVVYGQVASLFVYGTTLFIGGDFSTINKERRRNIGAVDLVTGYVTPWSPTAHDDVDAVAVTPAGAYLGGLLESVNGQERSNLAAIDAVTGKVTNWNPIVDSHVGVIAAAGNRIYVGGSFHTINGQARRGIAAFDAVSGALTSWAPGGEWGGMTGAISVTDQAVYLGGWFVEMGGKLRNNLAAVDPVTGLATAWNPGTNGFISSIAADGDNVYVGGNFTTIGGAAQNYLAAVDANTGLATGWNPGANSIINSLVLSGNTLYVGGRFTTMGGQPRNCLAAIDTQTGQPTPWNPNLKGEVNCIVPTGNVVYVGGIFDKVGDQSRRRLAAIDKTTGRATSWDPFGDFMFGDIYDLAVTDCAIYAAGGGMINFNAFGRRPAPLPKRNIIRGNLFADANANCTREAAEDSLSNFVVVAKPGPYFASTDARGNYVLAVDTGSYTISQVIPREKAHLITQLCPAAPAGHAVRFTGYGNEVKDLNFANRVVTCPQLAVSVASDRRRRCFRSNTTVAYRNDGLGTAEGVKIQVTFPRYVVPVSASSPWKRNADSSYTFEVGTLRPHQSGVVTLIDSVVCGMPAIRGLTQCTQARITTTTANACTPPPASHWDRSDIHAQAVCLDSSTVQLSLYNRGTGPMADSSRFRVYLDARLALVQTYTLPAGDSLHLRVVARGQTVRLEADQRPGYPGDETSVVTLEACGTDAAGQASRGFVAQLPVASQDPVNAVDCLPIVDSFDPNDKLVTPAGVTDEHYVPSGKALSYTIRFQNTGTDVAYRVVVVDTLSQHLDIATLQVGAVSHHPYQVAVTGEGRPVLTFTFTNINLPDSNRNEPASHGFIKFSIKPLATLAQGTRIENYADIFFDYNEPVRTNTVHNTVYDLPPPAPGSGGGRVIVCNVNTTVAAGPGRVLCEQDTVRLQAVVPLHGAGRWKRVGGGGSIAATTDANALVTGLAYGDNLFEWSVAANACGTDSLRARVTITRHPKPARPVVAQAADGLLHAGAEADGYRWYYNEAPLPDTIRTVRPVQAGRYAVQVRHNGCESDRSEAFVFAPAVTGLAPGTGRRYGIHPNPGTGRFYLVMPAGTGPVEVTLSDALGRMMMHRTVANHAADGGRYELDLSGRPAGIYLVQIRSGKDRQVLRLVKK